MLHILWLIIKWILILLGIVLAFLILAVVCLLFCPVSYQGQARKETGVLCGQGKVSWLLGALSFHFGYDKEKGGSYSLKIFGINASAYGRLAKKLKRTKKTSPKVPKVPGADSSAQESQKSESQERIELAEDTHTIHGEEKGKHEEEICRQPKNLFQKIGQIPGKIRQGFRDLHCTIQKICDKIRRTKDFFQNERTKAAIKLISEKTMQLLRHIGPKKIKGEICFGTGDPASTGQILGVLGIAYPIYKDSVTICPDFENTVLEGNLYIKGRIYGYFLLRTGVELYQNPDLKSLIQKIWKAK